VDEAFDVQSAELQAAKEMQRLVGNPLSYAQRVYRLLDIAISHDDEREIAVGSVDYAALLLMGRMANDVRAIRTLARLGYGVQAFTLAASILEVAFTFVDIATDDKRAAAWSNHTNSRHSFISARAAIKKFVRRMPWSDAQKQTAECSQKAVYEDLCQFKHANPRSMSPRAIDDGYFDNRLGPDTTDFGILTASTAILHAGWCVGLALHQWADARSLPAAARIRFDQELAALVRHYEVVDDQTRGLNGCFDTSIKSATNQQD
jgi:cytochrome c5